MVKQTISARGFYIHPEEMPQCSEWANKGLVEFWLILICASVLDKINGSNSPNLFLSRSIGMMKVNSSDPIISNALYQLFFPTG